MGQFLSTFYVRVQAGSLYSEKPTRSHIIQSQHNLMQKMPFLRKYHRYTFRITHINTLLVYSPQWHLLFIFISLILDWKVFLWQLLKVIITLSNCLLYMGLFLFTFYAQVQAGSHYSEKPTRLHIIQSQHNLMQKMPFLRK